MKGRTVVTTGLREAFGSRCAAWLLGALALAGPASQVHGQGPATNPAADAPVDRVPLAPTESSEDVRGELETVVPATGAVFDVGIEDLFPQRFNDARADLKE